MIVIPTILRISQLKQVAESKDKTKKGRKPSERYEGLSDCLRDSTEHHVYTDVSRLEDYLWYWNEYVFFSFSFLNFSIK